MPWGKLFRPLRKKFALRFSELRSTSPGDVFGEKHFWKLWFSCNFCALRKKFWSFAGNFLWRSTNNLLYGFRNRNSRVLKNELRSFFGKIHGSSIFSVFWPKFFCFREKIFAKGCQSFIRRVHMKALRIFFYNTMIFCNLCTLSGKVSHFCKTFTAGFPKHQSKCPGKLFAKIFFCKTVGIIIFPFFERKSRGSLLKIYDVGFETITYMSRETIWETFF